MASFWDSVGPGLFNTGLGLYTGQLEKDRAAKQLRKSQGPLFDQQQRLAGQSLNLAEGMDPRAMAADRFGQQQALLAPGNELAMQDLMRRLQKQGMLGVSSHAPVPGTVQTPGVAVNPHMAALFAAQEGARARSAYDSLGEGERYMDQLLNRGGMLQNQAINARSAGVDPRVQQLMPSKPGIRETLMRGAGKALQDPRTRTAVWEGVKALPGMFSGMFGGGGGSQDYFGGSDFSYGF